MHRAPVEATGKKSSPLLVEMPVVESLDRALENVSEENVFCNAMQWASENDEKSLLNVLLHACMLF